jgi:hypothetical protein
MSISEQRLRDDLDCLRLASDLTRLASYVPGPALQAHILRLAQSCTGLAERPEHPTLMPSAVRVARAHLH